MPAPKPDTNARYVTVHMKRELAALRVVANDTEKSLIAAKEELRSADLAIETSKGTLDYLEKDCKASKAECRALNTELALTKSELETSRVVVGQANAREASISEMFTSLKTEHDMLKVAHDTLHAMYASGARSCLALKTELDLTKTKLASNESELDATRVNLRKASGLATTWQDSANSFAADKSNLEDANKVLKIQLAATRSKLTATKSKLDAICGTEEVLMSGVCGAGADYCSTSDEETPVIVPARAPVLVAASANVDPVRRMQVDDCILKTDQDPEDPQSSYDILKTDQDPEDPQSSFDILKTDQDPEDPRSSYEDIASTISMTGDPEDIADREAFMAEQEDAANP